MVIAERIGSTSAHVVGGAQYAHVIAVELLEDVDEKRLELPAGA